jgi:hypothetical protein
MRGAKRKTPQSGCRPRCAAADRLQKTPLESRSSGADGLDSEFNKC